MVIWGASWRGKSQEVTELTATTQLKMKDAYILCNAIEILLMKENNKDIKMKAL
jgi:hypothetical protein